MGLGRKTKRSAENWLSTLLGLAIAIGVLIVLVLGVWAAVTIATGGGF